MSHERTRTLLRAGAALLGGLMVVACGPEVQQPRDPSLDPDPDPCFALSFDECVGDCQWLWQREGECGLESLGCFGPSHCERDIDCASWQSCVTVERPDCAPQADVAVVCQGCSVKPVKICLPGEEPT